MAWSPVGLARGGSLRCEKTPKNETDRRKLKLLTIIYDSYIIALLRCVATLPFFASLICDQEAAALTAHGPSSCLHPDGPDSGPRHGEERDSGSESSVTVRIRRGLHPFGETAKLRNTRASSAAVHVAADRQSTATPSNYCQDSTFTSAVLMTLSHLSISSCRNLAVSAVVAPTGTSACSAMRFRRPPSCTALATSL